MQMHRQSLNAYGAPLCETIVEAPQPQGTEALVRIERCGVCHSDLHMQDGYFLLGGGKKLFPDGKRANLKVIESKSFPTGVMLMRYVPDRSA